LLPPAGDLEVYVEFAATYLELTEFAPELLVTTFPGLADYPRIEAILRKTSIQAALIRGGDPAVTCHSGAKGSEGAAAG
jgi:hypothetical protein